MKHAKGSRNLSWALWQEGGKEVFTEGCAERTECGPHRQRPHGGCMDLEKRLPFSNARGGSEGSRRASRGLAGGVGEGDDSLQEKQSIAFKSHRVLIHPT